MGTTGLYNFWMKWIIELKAALWRNFVHRLLQMKLRNGKIWITYTFIKTRQQRAIEEAIFVFSKFVSQNISKNRPFLLKSYKVIDDRKLFLEYLMKWNSCKYIQINFSVFNSPFIMKY